MQDAKHLLCGQYRVPLKVLMIVHPICELMVTKRLRRLQWVFLKDVFVCMKFLKCVLDKITACSLSDYIRFRQNLVKSCIVNANYSKLSRNTDSLSLFWRRLVPMEMQVNHSMSSVACLGSLNMIYNQSNCWWSFPGLFLILKIILWSQSIYYWVVTSSNKQPSVHNRLCHCII